MNRIDYQGIHPSRIVSLIDRGSVLPYWEVIRLAREALSLNGNVWILDRRRVGPGKGFAWMPEEASARWVALRRLYSRLSPRQIGNGKVGTIISACFDFWQEEERLPLFEAEVKAWQR